MPQPAPLHTSILCTFVFFFFPYLSLTIFLFAVKGWDHASGFATNLMLFPYCPCYLNKHTHKMNWIVWVSILLILFYFVLSCELYISSFKIK